jgi:hypothetical protein
MKKIILTISLLIIGSFAFGQSDFTSEIDFYQSAYGLEKKSIVENFIQLDGEMATAFWTVYNEYEAERKEIGKSRIDNLNSYIEIYENMTDDQANDITGKLLTNRSSQEKLYKKYFGKMKKVVGAKTALQFLELEVYLQTAISYSILESIPFVGE